MRQVSLITICLYLILVVPVVPHVYAQEDAPVSFVLTIMDNQGVIEPLSLTKEPAIWSDNRTSTGDYRADLVDKEGEILASLPFDIANKVIAEPDPSCFTDARIDDSTCQREVRALDSATQLIILPYHPRASFIQLYSPSGERIVYVDVSADSEFCGDNICQDSESGILCPADCEKTLLNLDATTTNKLDIRTKILFGLISLLVILIILLVWLRMRNKSAPPSITTTNRNL